MDLGCAYGFTVARLRGLGIEAYGIDISELAISRASIQVKQFLKIAPLWELPFENQSIDFGFSSGVMEHIPEAQLSKSIREIVRVCNRGLIGVAVIDDPISKDKADDTHCQLKSLTYWKELFPTTFGIISDSQASWRVDATMSVFYLIRSFRGVK